MNERVPDEWISAYLDGELSPDERARIEAELGENAEARRTYEELQTLSSTIQSLPPYTLGDDFAARVAAKAEEAAQQAGSHRPATGQAINGQSRKTNDEQGTTGQPELARRDSRRWWTAVGAVAGVAAMIVIAAFLSTPVEISDVAQYREEESSPLGDKAESVATQPASTAAPAGSSAFGVSDPFERQSGDHDGLTVSSVNALDAAVEKVAADKSANMPSDAKTPLTAPAAQLAKSVAALNEGIVPPSSAPRTSNAPQPNSESKTDPLSARKLRGVAAAAGAAATPMRRAPGQPAPKVVQSPADPRGGSPAPAKRLQESASKSAPAIEDDLAVAYRNIAREDFFIVFANVTPGSIRQRTIDDSFARNGVVLTPVAMTPEAETAGSGQPNETAKAETGGVGGGGGFGGGGKAIRSLQEAQRLVEQKLGRATAEQTVDSHDAIVIEASAGQIEGVFADLKRRGDLVYLDRMEEPVAPTRELLRETKEQALGDEPTELSLGRRLWLAYGRENEKRGFRSEAAAGRGLPELDAVQDAPAPKDEADNANKSVELKKPQDEQLGRQPGVLADDAEPAANGQDAKPKTSTAARLSSEQRATWELLAKNRRALVADRDKSLKKAPGDQAQAGENPGKPAEPAAKGRFKADAFSHVAPAKLEPAAAATDSKRVRVLLFLRPLAAQPRPAAEPAASPRPAGSR